MHTDAYTADAICASMGLPLFEHDPACLGAARALHILLMPSFHREVCLTFVDGSVFVVGARAVIRHRFQPAPTWQSIDSPYCRKLLSQAGEFAGEHLPVQAEPARKPVIGTMVLGAPDDRDELLEALRMIPGEGESQ